jgi:hypothetical protein
MPVRRRTSKVAADTLNEMILGFSVILGILLVYILSLIVRMRRARLGKKNIGENPPES